MFELSQNEKKKSEVNESKYECHHTASVNLLNFQVVMGLFHSIDWNKDIYYVLGVVIIMIEWQMKMRF